MIACTLLPCRINNQRQRRTLLDLGIQNRLALVSGSTYGIGRAIAEALLAEGARVIINGRSEANVKETVSALSHKGSTSSSQPATWSSSACSGGQPW